MTLDTCVKILNLCTMQAYSPPADFLSADKEYFVSGNVMSLRWATEESAL